MATFNQLLPNLNHMNLGSHIAVAEILYPESPAIWLGAALPDLASIGRFRLLGTTNDPAILAGLALHHQTDDLFHRSLWFTQRQRRLSHALTAAGLGRGPTRAIAHVGPELLLDGALLNKSQLHQQIDSAFAQISALESQLGSLAPGEQAPFLSHLREVAAWGAPLDYHDPQVVAHRLQRILLRRPRLAFDPTSIDLVATKLASENKGITTTSVGFVQRIADDLFRASH